MSERVLITAHLSPAKHQCRGQPKGQTCRMREIREKNKNTLRPCGIGWLMRIPQWAQWAENIYICIYIYIILCIYINYIYVCPDYMFYYVTVYYIINITII